MRSLSELSDDELARLALRSVRELPDAPTWLVESAVAMWRAPAVQPSLGRRIAAVLGFDSWAAQPRLALRSAVPVARQLLFTAQDRDVDLRVSPNHHAGEPTHYTLAGQVLGPGEGGAVMLSLGGVTLGQALLDDFGEFRFDSLPAGTYAVTLRIGDDDILLPDIDLGGEASA